MSMTGMDEIIMKTPDALFNGEAAYKVIESCCPFVKNARLIPSTDVETLLIAIRVATYGKILKIDQNCKACDHENQYDLDLEHITNYFQSINFNNEMRINESIVVNIRPLTYEQMNYFSLENFKLQKTALQAINLEDEEEKRKLVDQVYSDMAELQFTLCLTAIEQVKVNNEIVDNRQHILEWLKNMDRDVYNSIKEQFETNRNKWEYPEQAVKCGNCATENTIKPMLDQSNFFV